MDVLIVVADALPKVTRLGATGFPATDVATRMAAVHESFRNRLAQGLEPAVEQLEGILRRGLPRAGSRTRWIPINWLA